MTQRKNNDESKGRKKDSKNMKVLSPKQDEDFNTGSHSPSSVRKVGAGYDDTGKGNDFPTSKSADKNAYGRQKKTKEKHT
ncbi:MAG TPA: hypothetical protein VK492_05595 [Chitinophagaceae bacterium]|nr:hypothetical protein [Chitinophagaceae bacterium]